MIEIRKMASSHQSGSKSWKLIHDPLLKKGLQKLYRYDGVASGNPAYNVFHVTDPRSLASRFLSRSEPVDLPIPTFAIDDNYVGRPALRELAFFDLNDNVNENFLTDMCKKCGVIEEVKVFFHPTTRRHLGMARVVYRSEREASACLERYNRTSIMGKTVQVVADPWGKRAKEGVEQLINKSQNTTLDQTSSKIRDDEGTPSTIGQIPAMSNSSLESRIQQLLAAEQSMNGLHLEENGSTPVQDEHNIAIANHAISATKIEKTSDDEMSLSSGEEDQCNSNSRPANHKDPIVVAGSAHGDYTNGTMPPGYFCPQAAYMYYVAPHMAPMIPPPPPGFMPMWPPPFPHGYTPTPVPPTSYPPSQIVPATALPHQSETTSDAETCLRITSKSVLEVKNELKTVLRKDIVKRAVEASVFQSIESWYAKKESEHKARERKRTDVSNNNQVAGGPSTSWQQTPVGVTLSNLFDSQTSSSDFTPSLTGVPGLGLRASLPKLPSFKRKIIRPPTPKSSSPSQDNSSVSSSSSSSSSSESEDDEKSSTASNDVVRARGRRSRRLRSSSSSSGAKTASSRSSSRESESKSVHAAKRPIVQSDAEEEKAERRMEPISDDEIEEDEVVQKASAAEETKEERRMEPISDDEIEDEIARKTDEAEKEKDERRMEPISDDEIEDELDAVDEDEEASTSEEVEDEKRPPDIADSDKMVSEEEEEEIENKKVKTETIEKANLKKILSSPLAESDNSDSKLNANRLGVAKLKKLGRNARVASTTEDELSGLENGDIAIKASVSERSIVDDLVEIPKPVVERPDGVMFVEEGCRYNPYEFDHHYAMRLPETSSSSSTIPSTDAASRASTSFGVLKPKQAVVADSAVAAKQKTVQKVVKPPKPKRPAITFKPRTEAEDAKICQQFFESGIDDEDIAYVKMVYDKSTTEGVLVSSFLRWTTHVATAEPPYKKRRLLPDEIPSHSTGCARTQGFYRLSHKEKRIKSRPRQALEYTEAQNQQNVNMAKQQLNVSREARSMQRRLLTTLGSELDSDLLKYNQLKFRKKLIKFSRSHIHGWGLFAMEDIAQDEMIVEYVGQKIRITVAEKREQKYEKMGVGSSYLFRIDNEMVVDATKRGNIARFINHSCNPNCYARIITVEGEKRIVIYSKQNINRGEEITYDYKFPLENEKIPCNCGAPCCRGSLN